MAAGPRRGGDTAPGTPGGKDPPGRGSCRQRSGPARPGSARSRQGPPGRGGQSAQGRRQPRAGVLPSSPRDGCAATAAGPLLRGDACPCPRLAFCLALPRGWGSPSPERNRPVRRAPKQQGQDPALGRRRRVRSGPASEMEVPRHREAARPQKSGRNFTEYHILRY